LGFLEVLRLVFLEQAGMYCLGREDSNSIKGSQRRRDSQVADGNQEAQREAKRLGQWSTGNGSGGPAGHLESSQEERHGKLPALYIS